MALFSFVLGFRGLKSSWEHSFVFRLGSDIVRGGLLLMSSGNGVST